MSLKLDGLSDEAVLDDAKINNGVWIHLESASSDPTTGLPVPLYLGGDQSKPQRALVRSYRCKAIKEAEAKLQKDGFVKVRLAKKKERDGVIAESSALKENVRFSLMLVALDNVGKGGGVQQVEPQDAMEIHASSAYDNIVQQVREAAYDDSNYLAGADTEAGNASTPIKTGPKTGTSAS